jgi:uncharacterized damage-inducible protein DinB
VNADYFRTLYNYNYWAHRHVWDDCIVHLTDEQFTRDIGYSWRSIHGQVVHTMSAEWIWLSRLEGISPTSMFKNEDYPDRSVVRAKWDEIETQVRAYMDRLLDTQLDEIVHYQNTSGQSYSKKRFEILAHLANHGTDHRAQILAMLYQLDAPTIGQDCARRGPCGVAMN